MTEKHEAVADGSGARGASIIMRPVRSEESASSRVLSHVTWGLGGFLVGALFWHLIGFWDFLGAVIGPKRGASPSVIGRMLKEPPSANGIASGDSLEARAQQAARQCTTLVLDRATGETRAEPCMLVIRNVPGEVEATARPPLQTASRIDQPAGK